jgi:hypothetical protein
MAWEDGMPSSERRKQGLRKGSAVKFGFLYNFTQVKPKFKL